MVPKSLLPPLLALHTYAAHALGHCVELTGWLALGADLCPHGYGRGRGKWLFEAGVRKTKDAPCRAHVKTLVFYLKITLEQCPRKNGSCTRFFFRIFGFQ